MPRSILKSTVVVLALLSFRSIDKKVFEFNYPRNTTSSITLSTERFKTFTKEWRGSDFYYYTEADGFICSILYYKLNDGEKFSLVEAPKFATGGPESSPVYPYAYFKNFSYFKALEANDSTWGKPSDDFMFRQNDIPVEGTKSSEKNMYGYCMFGNDLFVNIHISKIDCSGGDSSEMVNMLKTLTMTNKNKINMAFVRADIKASNSKRLFRQF